MAKSHVSTHQSPPKRRVAAGGEEKRGLKPYLDPSKNADKKDISDGH